MYNDYLGISTLKYPLSLESNFMQILGIRTSSACIRYAVVEWNEESATFINKEGENKLNFPVTAINLDDKIVWIQGEVNRILNEYPKITKVAIKTNEYVKESKATRCSVYLDGCIIGVVKQRNKAVSCLLNVQIQKGMNGKKIKDFAKTNVDCSTTYWDDAMAHAIAVAWTVRNA